MQILRVVSAWQWLTSRLRGGGDLSAAALTTAVLGVPCLFGLPKLGIAWLTLSVLLTVAAWIKGKQHPVSQPA